MVIVGENTIQEQVGDYRVAQGNLDMMERAKEVFETEYATELEAMAEIQKRLDAQLAKVLTSMGINKTSKDYEATLKKIRKALYGPMVGLVEQGHPNIEGKTYAEEDFAVTLVEQKAKLQRKPGAGLQEHKDDVQLLLDQQMYSSIEIKADADTLAWMGLREKNEMPSLKSVVVVKGGYCKVKLEEK